MEIYRTIPQQIAAHLRNEVLSGKLKAGDPLREIEISERFEVSRGPVREALRKLTQQGLVVLEPNKGVRVAPSPSASMRPLIVELRQKIETYVIESNFEDIQEALPKLETILAGIKQACETDDTTSLVEQDLMFHKTIIECYDDNEVFAIWEPIMIRMLMNYGRHTNLMDSYHEHKRIVDAIRAGDKSETMKTLRENIQ